MVLSILFTLLLQELGTYGSLDWESNKIPVKFIVGDLDPTYNAPGTKDYINKGGFKRDVPLLEKVVVMEGLAHFINQERAHEIDEHIYNFFHKF